MDNNTGVQTRAMAEAQCIEGETNRDPINNPEQAQDTHNPAMNLTADLCRTRERRSRSLSKSKAQSPWIGMYQTFTTPE